MNLIKYRNYLNQQYKTIHGKIEKNTKYILDLNTGIKYYLPWLAIYKNDETNWYLIRKFANGWIIDNRYGYNK